MSANMSVKVEGLERLAQALQNPAISQRLERLPNDRAVAAIVAQSIADNFDKQGPGWAPLKGATIRRSIAKKILKIFQERAMDRMRGVRSLRDVRKQKRVGEMNALIDKMLERNEHKYSGTLLSNRAILRKTNTLFKSVTTTSSAHNIWPNQNEKFTLVWGTDLVYAGVHNAGYPPRKIPKREYLVIREKWQKQLNDYVVQRAIQAIQSVLRLG